MTPIQNARLRLLLRSPFYGTIMMTTPLVETESKEVSTAATDGERIYYNPKFFAMLRVEEIVFVLAHEVLHIVLMHTSRMLGRDGERWNDACDYAINPILIANGFTMPRPPHHGLFDQKYVGKSAEVIYAMLPDTPPPPGSRGSLSGDLRRAPRTLQQDELKARIAMAATVARLAGNMPAGLDQLITSLLHPQVPWLELLRQYMTVNSPTKQDWSHRNRRFPTVYLPRRRGRRIGKIGIINDASGSVGQNIRNAFATEVRAIADETGAEEIHVRHADTKTQAEQRFGLGEPIILRPRGGGGTDMRVPLAEFEAEREDIECVVMLTDGLTPWPAVEPLVPLIVCCTTDAPVPVGSVVRIVV